MKWKFSDRNYLTFNSAYGMYQYYFDHTGQETTNFFSRIGRRIVHYSGDRVLQTALGRCLNHLKGVFCFEDSHILSVGLEHQEDQLEAPFRLSQGKRSAYTISAYAQGEWTVNKNL